MSDSCVIQAPVSVYQFSSQSEKLISDSSSARVYSTGQFEFRFDIVDGSQILLSANIVSALNLNFSIKYCSLYFDIRYNNKLHNLKLVFHNEGDLNRFVNIFVNCLYENNNKERVKAADIPELDAIVNSMNIDNQSQEYDGDQFDNDELDDGNNKNTDGGKNFLLRIAPSVDNTMVMRNYSTHSDLGLFTSDSQCLFRQNIQNIADESNNSILASDMITNNNEHGLYVLDNKRPYEVFNLNLDRGMVVSHLNAVDSSNQQHKVNHILHTNQGDTSSPTFVGFNNKNTLLLDSRVEKSIVNHSDYKTDNLFTCGVTTRSGRIAMGSSKGIIRLYKEPCRGRATCNFQANVGEPITSIDVSPNEEWIVATSPYCILTFCVLAKSTGKLGFDSPMKQDRPPLTRLTISQRDQQRIAAMNNGDLLPFTNAKFETRNGKVVSIIASIGNALVAWGFKSIENNKIPKYSITMLSGGEPIIDNQPFENNSDILYMSPNELSVARRGRRH